MVDLDEWLKMGRECPIVNCKFKAEYEKILEHVMEFHNIKLTKIISKIHNEEKVDNHISVRWNK